jgi:hypothetical protein
MSNAADPAVIEWLRNLEVDQLVDVLRPLWNEEKLQDLAFYIDPLSQSYLERC